MGNYFVTGNEPAFLGEQGSAELPMVNDQIQEILTEDGLNLFALAPQMIRPGMGFKRLNPGVNKDYFKLRAVNGPQSKIPGVDTGSFSTWNKKGGAIQNPYDDYNLTYKYWDDESWNTDNSKGYIDAFTYSAEKNPLFESATPEEIEEMDTIFQTFTDENLYQSNSLKVENDANLVYNSLGGDPIDGEDPLRRPKKKLKLRSDDFEPNLGKVIDTLNSDYPLLFYKPLDYSIYIKDIEVTDPTGIAFQGIGVYKNLFTALRFFAKTIFKSQDLTYKINYDYME